MEEKPDTTHGDPADDFVSELDQRSIRLHEIFSSLRRSGFTKTQAEGMVTELVPETFGGLDD
jgi:hypothetical protein